jgi:hypothetical protein
MAGAPASSMGARAARLGPGSTCAPGPDSFPIPSLLIPLPARVSPTCAPGQPLRDTLSPAPRQLVRLRAATHAVTPFSPTPPPSPFARGRAWRDGPTKLFRARYFRGTPWSWRGDLTRWAILFFASKHVTFRRTPKETRPSQPMWCGTARCKTCSWQAGAPASVTRTWATTCIATGEAAKANESCVSWRILALKVGYHQPCMYMVMRQLMTGQRVDAALLLNPDSESRSNPRAQRCRLNDGWHTTRVWNFPWNCDFWFCRDLH